MRTVTLISAKGAKNWVVLVSEEKEVSGPLWNLPVDVFASEKGKKHVKIVVPLWLQADASV